MKKLLRTYLNWLERKFPDRIEVTVAEYNSLLARMDRLTDLQDATDEWAVKIKERIEKTEIAINNLNVTAGLGGLAADKFKMAPFSR